MDTVLMLDFSAALLEAKAGKKITRIAFGPHISVTVQFPDAGSKNTLPYMQMHKADTGAIFPVDFSCESIFANDWYVVNN